MTEILTAGIISVLSIIWTIEGFIWARKNLPQYKNTETFSSLLFFCFRGGPLLIVFFFFMAPSGVYAFLKGAYHALSKRIG